MNQLVARSAAGAGPAAAGFGLSRLGLQAMTGSKLVAGLAAGVEVHSGC